MQYPKEIQMTAHLPPEEMGTSEVTSRPQDAAISCARFWGGLLILAGIIETVVGAILFMDWRGTGGLWVGIVAISAGVAGMFMSRSRQSGGAATAFFMVLTFLTFLAALFAVIMGDGLNYLVVAETEGNCYDTIACEDNTCWDSDCVCWEPDGSRDCEDGHSLRYCVSYKGSDCSGIADSESILLGSSIILLVISVKSFFALLVSIATCFCCNRLIQNPHNPGWLDA